MKKKMTILKFLKLALINSSICFLTIFNSFATNINSETNQDITSIFNSEFSNVLNNYKSKRLLNADILDSNNPIIKSFLNSNTRGKSDQLLAINYFPTFQLNNIETSFCFVFYNSKENIFKQYEQYTNLNRKETFQYLLLHEIGHCLAFHENYIKHDRIDEKIADSFAVAVALNENNYDLATKFSKQINTVSTNDIHGNGRYIQNFLNEIVKENFFATKKTTNEIIDIIIFFNEHNSFDGFNFGIK